MRSQYVSASASYCCRAALYSATLRLYSNAPNIDCATRIDARDLSAGSAANPWDGDNSNAASRHPQLLRTEWSRIAPPGDAQRLPNICNRTSIHLYRYGARPSAKTDDSADDDTETLLKSERATCTPARFYRAPARAP